jgi:purine-binding chemotaxis protein CheW
MPEPSASPGSAELRRFLTFKVAEQLFAVPAEFVAEIIELPSVARVPHSPTALLGLANLRGAVLPLVSSRALLGLGEQTAPRNDKTRAVVVEASSPLALAVDSVDALVSVANRDIEVSEAELGAAPGERLAGAFRIGKTAAVAKILDIDGLVNAAFAQRKRNDGKARGRTASLPRTAAEEADNAAERPAMLVTFDVAGQEFALELEVVQEILPAPAAPTGVPRAEALVLGVTSLRDRLLPLLSLRGLLGFPQASASDGREKVIVMRVGGAQVGLVADRARAIVAARRASIDAIPAALAARTAGEARIKAIYRGDNGRRLISILTPEQLFREDVMRRLGQRTETENLAAQQSESAGGQLQFLVFRLGTDEFALPIAAVDEVAEVPATIARLPKTPKFLEGVVNLRGDVLPIVDQRRRFEMPPLADRARRRLVVVRSEQHRAGLIVDSVSDVLRVPLRALAPAPQLSSDMERLVRGVLNLTTANRMVLVLDPSELLTPQERGRLDAFQKAARETA